MKAVTPRIVRNPYEYASAIKNLGAWQFLLCVVHFFRAKLQFTPKAYMLYSKYLRFPVYCRPKTTDLHVFNQIFTRRCYRCLDDLNHVGLVIDCGANVGYSAAYFLNKFPQAFLIAVEPDLGNFKMMEENLAVYRGRYRAICTGVWSQPTRLVFEETTRGEGQEWGRRLREATEGEQDEMMAVDIATLLAESGYGRVSVLKVDIEGAEMAVFGSNYEEWLPKVDNLVIELHGPQCDELFRRAIVGQDFKLSRSGELVVCRRYSV